MTYTEHLIQRIDEALAENVLEEKFGRGILSKIAAAGIGAAALGGGMAPQGRHQTDCCVISWLARGLFGLRP
jgi:hypothetical protein